MSVIREQVSEFHRAFDQPVLDWPQVPPDERVRLRLRLVLEEAFELLEACVVTTRLRSVDLLREKVFELIEDVEVKVGLVALADALADLDYVSEGTRLEFGIDGAPIAAEVHRSNMAKVWPDGTVQKNEGGKVLKPPDWTPPDIYNELLKQQCGQPVAQGAASTDEVLELNRVSIELAKRLSVLEERVDHHVVDATVGNKVVTPATADEVQELRRAVSGLAERLGHAEGAIVGVTRGLLLR